MTKNKNYAEQLEEENLDLVQKLNQITTDKNALTLYSGKIETDLKSAMKNVKDINEMLNVKDLIIENLQKELVKRDEWISMTISTMQNAINEHGIICDDILAKPMTFNNDIEKNDNEVPF